MDVPADGTRIVYIADERLYVRAMDAPEAIPMERAQAPPRGVPFLSPDGEWVGFHAEGELRKASCTRRSRERLSES